ncbi:hypothetical protein SprV_0501848500 [Sparganum proliferum]
MSADVQGTHLSCHLRAQCAINTPTSHILAPSANFPPTATPVTVPPPSSIHITAETSTTTTALTSRLPLPMGRRPTSHKLQTPPPTSPPPATWARSIPVLITIAHPPHTSTCSVTCESIAQRLANQCLEHQPTPAASASTTLTAPPHSPTAWAY